MSAPAGYHWVLCHLDQGRVLYAAAVARVPEGGTADAVFASALRHVADQYYGGDVSRVVVTSWFMAPNVLGGAS